MYTIVTTQHNTCFDFVLFIKIKLKIKTMNEHHETERKVVFKGEGRWAKELLVNLENNKVMEFVDKEKLKAIREEEGYRFLLKIPKELDEEIRKKKGVDNLSTELKKRIKFYNTKALHENVYDFLNPPIYDKNYYYQFKKKTIKNSEDERCKSWPRKQLDEHDWDTLEIYVDLHQLELSEGVGSWNWEVKRLLWTYLSPIFKGFRSKQISEQHALNLKAVLLRYPSIYDIEGENRSTIVHQAAYHDQEKILKAIFDSNPEKARKLLNKELTNGVKPIHNTFFPSDGAKSALKARTFLFHRIKEASEETLLPIEEYLLWSDNAKTVREKHEKMDDTLLDAFKAFKKRKGVNGEEPDPKRIHSV
eukprot:m.46531 g.46531  ORF g.46531 m.46531 type:complete len:362 (+) comp10383_c0_seq2:230-1315(+)